MTFKRFSIVLVFCFLCGAWGPAQQAQENVEQEIKALSQGLFQYDLSISRRKVIKTGQERVENIRNDLKKGLESGSLSSAQVQELAEKANQTIWWGGGPYGRLNFGRDEKTLSKKSFSNYVEVINPYDLILSHEKTIPTTPEHVDLLIRSLRFSVDYRRRASKSELIEDIKLRVEQVRNLLWEGLASKEISSSLGEDLEGKLNKAIEDPPGYYGAFYGLDLHDLLLGDPPKTASFCNGLLRWLSL